MEFVRGWPLLWAWQLLVLSAPLIAMRINYEWWAPQPHAELAVLRLV